MAYPTFLTNSANCFQDLLKPNLNLAILIKDYGFATIWSMRESVNHQFLVTQPLSVGTKLHAPYVSKEYISNLSVS